MLTLHSSIFSLCLRHRTLGSRSWAECQRARTRTRPSGLRAKCSRSCRRVSRGPVKFVIVGADPTRRVRSPALSFRLGYGRSTRRTAARLGQRPYRRSDADQHRHPEQDLGVVVSGAAGGRDLLVFRRPGDGFSPRCLSRGLEWMRRWSESPPFSLATRSCMR